MTVRKLKAVAPRLEALVAQDQDLLKTHGIMRHCMGCAASREQSPRTSTT